MKDPETRRGVSLRAGVSLVAVAATVAATFALAGPASAAVTAISQTPATATVSAGTAQTFTITPTGVASGDVITVTATEAANSANPLSGGTNPLTINNLTGTGYTAGSATPGNTTNWTDSVTVTAGATPAASFTIDVKSAQAGSVSVTSSSGTGTATSTLTVLAQPSSVAISPKAASAFAGSATDYTVTAKYSNGTVAAAGTLIHVTASEPTPTGGSAPTLTITPASGTGSAVTGASPRSTTAAVTGSAGQATFTVASDTAGTVTVTAAADNAGSASTTTLDSAVLTVLASSTPNANVTSLSVTPTSTGQYQGGTGPIFKATATGTGSTPVSGATVNYQVNNGGPSGVLGTTTGSDGTVSGTINTTSLAPGTYTATFWVNNATSGATSGPDAGEPQTTATIRVDAAPTVNTPVLSTPSNTLPAGRNTTVPFTVTLTPSGSNPASAAAGVHVAVDATPSASGSTTTRYQGVTGSDGTATINVPVTALEAANTNTLSAVAYISESATAGQHIGSASNNETVTFAVSAPFVKASALVQSVKGGTVSIPVTVADQFDNAAGSGDTLSYSVASGSNAGTTGTVTVGADGKATVTYADKGGTGVSDAVTTSDLTHPAYDSNSGANTSTTVNYVSSVTPAKIDWNGQPGTNLTPTVNSTPYANYTVTVTNSAGEVLIGQSVTFTVDNGFVGDSTVTASTGSTSYTATTDTSGHAVVYVGSTTAGTQTITATDGGVSQAGANKITYDATVPYTVTLTGPSNIALSGSGKFTAKVTDKYGNPLQGQDVSFAQSGTGNFTGGVSSAFGVTAADGTVTVTLQAGDTAGSGSVVATDSNVTTTQATDITAAPTNTATAKYTVGAAVVSQVKVAGIKGVGVGGTEKIAVRVWNSDGSLAAGATVNVKVTGANTASGTATTGPNGELGWFSYTAKHAGTDHVTATIGGKSDTTTVTISSAISSHLFHPVAQANGTFLYSVQTIPATAGARVNLFAVYHPGKSDQALFHAGNSTTNAAGRAARATSPGYLVHGHFKHYRAGQTYVLVAKVVGSAGQSNMSSATAK